MCPSLCTRGRVFGIRGTLARYLHQRIDKRLHESPPPAPEPCRSFLPFGRAVTLPVGAAAQNRWIKVHRPAQPAAGYRPALTSGDCQPEALDVELDDELPDPVCAANSSHDGVSKPLLREVW